MAHLVSGWEMAEEQRGKKGVQLGSACSKSGKRGWYLDRGGCARGAKKEGNTFGVAFEGFPGGLEERESKQAVKYVSRIFFRAAEG